MVSFFRILKFAFQDLGRNLSLFFTTVFTLILMLLSINVLLSLDAITKEAVSNVKRQIDVSFYFSSSASSTQVAAIEQFINDFPEVTSVNLISRDEVLKAFRHRHRNQSETLQALDELDENPFGPTLVVKTQEPKDYKKIIDALDVPEYKKLIETRSFDSHEDAIERLQNITNRIEKIGFGLTALFAIISFLVIFNTIRITIRSQKREISIKRLVGASNWFIRGPYIVESVIFTVVSVAATIGLVFLALEWVDPYLAVVFPNAFSLTNYYQSNIFLLFGVQTLAVLLLTILSTALAMRRQLKV